MKDRMMAITKFSDEAYKLALVAATMTERFTFDTMSKEAKARGESIDKTIVNTARELVAACEMALHGEERDDDNKAF